MSQELNRLYLRGSSSAGSDLDIEIVELMLSIMGEAPDNLGVG